MDTKLIEDHQARSRDTSIYKYRAMSMTEKIRAALARISLILLHKVYTRRWIEWRGLRLYISKSCFIPLHTMSSDILADFVNPRGRVLDIGCGCGSLAIYLAREWRVHVVGYDIDPHSIATARINAIVNRVSELTHFTLSLNTIPRHGFDTVVSNPPYLPLEPRKPMDKLWCCGSDYRVLQQILLLARYALRAGGRLYIALSSITPLENGLALAKVLGFDVEDVVCRPSPLDRVCAVRLRLRNVVIN